MITTNTAAKRIQSATGLSSFAVVDAMLSTAIKRLDITPRYNHRTEAWEITEVDLARILSDLSQPAPSTKMDQ